MVMKRQWYVANNAGSTVILHYRINNSWLAFFRFRPYLGIFFCLKNEKMTKITFLHRNIPYYKVE